MATWISVTGQMGLTYPGSIDSVKCTAVGTIVRFRSETLGEGEFIYLAGAAAVDAGDVCTYEITYNASVATSVVAPWAGAANIPAPLCVAAAATVAGTWGWYQVSGSAVVNSSGTIAEGDDLFWQAAGVVSASLASGTQMMNAVAASANGVPATNKVIVTIDRPLAQGSADGPDIDVRAFGVTMNGTTNDTAGVIAAVAAAAATGRTLYWPPGTALTTATIPLLHTVQHVGPGIIKRGSDLFAVDPRATNTNHFYTSPSGNATNDGLSSSQPMTPQAAADAWMNYGPECVGDWQLDFAAGNHANILLNDALSGSFRLVGVATGDFTSQPTSVIDFAACDPGARIGIYFHGAGKRVFIKDIRVKDFDDEATVGTGLRCEYFAVGTYENLWTVNCFRGRFHEVFAEHNSKGGVMDGSHWGSSELFGVVRNYAYAGSKANGTLIRNCVTGQHAKELCTGHDDYLRIEDCDQGILFTRCVTANLSNVDFRRNTIGAVVGPGSAVINNLSIRWNGQPVTSASWAAGTVTFGFALDAFGRGVNVLVGETFVITAATPSGYNGTFVALTATDTSLTAALVSDPGAWVSGGLSNANGIQILPWNPNILLQDGPGGNVEDVVATPYWGMVEKVRNQLLAPVTVQTTTALTILWFPTPGFKPGEFQAEGYHARIEASGVYTFGSAATFNFRAGTTNMEVFNLASGTHSWEFNGKVTVTATGNFQYHKGTLLVDGQSVQTANGTETLDMAAIEYVFGLWCQPSSVAAGNTMTINQATLYTTVM